MPLQRLTSLDIHVLGHELDSLLSGRTLAKVVARENEIHFASDGLALSFVVVTGCPYLMLSDTLPPGRTWLQAITGARIKNVRQMQHDRVLVFELALFDSLGKRKDFKLFLEFFRNGDVILADSTDKIISSLKRAPRSGAPYTLPAPPAIDILAWSENHELQPVEIEALRKLKLFQHSTMSDQHPLEIMKQIALSKDRPQPHLLRDASGRAVGFSVYGPTLDGLVSGKVTAERQPSLLAALTEYVKANLVSRSKVEDYRRRLKRACKKLENLEQQLDEARDFPQFRKFGEIILANMKNIKRTDDRYLLLDHYSPDQQAIEIPINPALSPEKNAETFFDKARKLESALPLIEKRIEKQKLEVARLEQLVLHPPVAERSEARVMAKKLAEEPKLPFRHYGLGGGWKVYVGKSATSNDELTFAFARKDDLWFHAWQAAGSHLILRRPRKGAVPDRDTLLKAASIAAYFSKAKTSSKVPVIYTEVRHVRKIKKAPGKVLVSHEKQVMVQPRKPVLAAAEPTTEN